MAALDFPSNPQVNDVYSENGRTFIWNGSSWKSTNSGIPGYTGSAGAGYTGSAGTSGTNGYTGSAGTYATSRTVEIADGTSITMNADTTDIAYQNNTQAVGTLTINAPTGSPVDGQRLMLRLKSTNVQTFSWNGAFIGSNEITLPSVSTGGSKYDYMGFIYESTSTKWHLISTVFGY